MLPLWAKVDQEVIAMNGFCAFFKAPVLWETYPSAEMYSTAPADWVNNQSKIMKTMSSSQLGPKENLPYFTFCAW